MSKSDNNYEFLVTRGVVRVKVHGVFTQSRLDKIDNELIAEQDRLNREAFGNAGDAILQMNLKIRHVIVDILNCYGDEHINVANLPFVGLYHLAEVLDTVYNECEWPFFEDVDKDLKPYTRRGIKAIKIIKKAFKKRIKELENGGWRGKKTLPKELRFGPCI